VSSMKLVSAIKKISSKRPVTIINIFGLMGEGKTNIARLIAKHFDKEYDVYYEQAPDPIEAISLIHSIKSPKLLLILDDLSFMYHGHSDKVRRFENVIARIRHITESGRVILVMIYHYFRSVMPFMRMAQIHVLTSVTWNEMSMLKEIFRYRYLKEFYKLYDAIVWGTKVKNLGVDLEKNKPALVKALTRHAIVWVPLVEDYDFEKKAKRVRRIEVPEILSLEDFIAKCVRANLGYKQALRLARELGYRSDNNKFHELFARYSKLQTPDLKKVVLCARA